MSVFETMFEEMKNTEEFKYKARMLAIILRSLSKSKKKIAADDLNAIESFTVSELEKLVNEIPKAGTYAEKSKIFEYEDMLLGLVTFLVGDRRREIGASDMEIIKTVVHMVDREMWLEKELEEMFAASRVEKSAVSALIEKVKPLSDETHRSVFFQGLLHFSDDIGKMSDEANRETGSFLLSELKRYFAKKDGLSEDETNNVELLADVCKHFKSEEMLNVINELLSLGHNNVNYYAAETLLSAGREPSAEVVAALANDLSYAELTYRALAHYKKQALFPAELANAEYLAKSDLSHWLVYPTELGKLPAEIELLGSVKAHRSVYYVFRFKSDSDNLSDECKNEWLIGWSNADGGTFSNFDRLSLFEQKTPEKTLKYIKKKLL
ncbi:MAG: hypothetical protein HFE35_04890 [Clostridia bacterium]|nr:hypothetical protein [Clostridia bacterium]